MTPTTAGTDGYPGSALLACGFRLPGPSRTQPGRVILCGLGAVVIWLVAGEAHSLTYSLIFTGTGAVPSQGTITFPDPEPTAGAVPSSYSFTVLGFTMDQGLALPDPPGVAIQGNNFTTQWNSLEGRHRQTGPALQTLSIIFSGSSWDYVDGVVQRGQGTYMLEVAEPSAALLLLATGAASLAFRSKRRRAFIDNLTAFIPSS